VDLEQTRRTLLEATLPHVAFDGWSTAALRAGAADAGLDEATARNAFPGGPAEMIEDFSTGIDRRMLAELETRDLASARVRDRIKTAVRVRLELMTPHREAVRRALGFLALPRNVPLATTCLYRTLDAMWYAAGDTATDYNFYTKRLLLAGVYCPTLLVWLNDRSEGFADTWAFLGRRLDDALRASGTFGRVAGDLLDLPDRIFARLARS